MSLPPTTPIRLANQLATALLLCCAAWGCTEPRSDSQLRPNVIVILVDTLRADRVESSEGSGSITPFLDSLAGRSYVFGNAYSASSWTSPAVASLFTSRYQSQHGVTTFVTALAQDEKTLAELMQDQGYATGGFSANSLIRSELGFGQGFDYFRIERGKGPAYRRTYERTAGTGRRATKWIDRLQQKSARPVFLYLHVMDPHSPYAPNQRALDWAFEGRPRPDLQHMNDLVFTHAAAGATEREDVELTYDAEVRSMDRALERVFSALEERGLLRDAVVVVLSDHGEEFWDHELFGHANGLHDEVIRVPLLISLPGQSTRVEIREPVSIIDVAPTLLELVGGETPASFEGRSLAPMLSLHRGGVLRWLERILDLHERPSTPVVSELIQPAVHRSRPHERAVVIGRFKLIADTDGTHRFFDRESGVQEQPGDAIPAAARARLESALAAFVSRMPVERDAPQVPMDTETRTELRALGYIE